MEREKRQGFLWGLIIFLIVLLIGAGVFLYFQRKPKETEQKKGVQAEKATEVEGKKEEKAASEGEQEKWVAFTNVHVGYTLKHPSDWKAKEVNVNYENRPNPYNYVLLTSPQNNVLRFGLKKKYMGYILGDPLEMEAEKDKKPEGKAITFLGTKLVPLVRVGEDPPQAYYFWFADNKDSQKVDFEIWIKFYPSKTKSKEQMKALSDELPTVKKIISSAAWSPQPVWEKYKKAMEVAENFMEARKQRDLELAKPYVTEKFYNSTTQADFAGASSPSLGKYNVLSVSYFDKEEFYKVMVEVHWYLQGEESGTSTWELFIVEEDGKMLVDKVTGGYE
jgi:hypothetical protein